MAEAQQNINMPQMLELMKQFAAELKKPSAEEQAKIDAEKANLLRRQQASIANSQREKQQRDVEQSMCSHMKSGVYSGQTRIVAPLHNDGLHHPLCLGCNKEFKPFAPSPETIPLGMSLGDYRGITPEIINHWGAQHEKAQQGRELVAELVK